MFIVRMVWGVLNTIQMSHPVIMVDVSRMMTSVKEYGVMVSISSLSRFNQLFLQWNKENKVNVNHFWVFSSNYCFLRCLETALIKVLLLGNFVQAEWGAMLLFPLFLDSLAKAKGIFAMLIAYGMMCACLAAPTWVACMEFKLSM